MAASVVILEQDAAWMLAFQAGDSAAYAILLQKYRDPVIHYLYRFVHNRAVAEELAQDVFIRVYRSRNYQPSAKFRTWLFRVATNVALNWIRDEQGDNAVLSLDQEPERGPSREPRSHTRTAEETLVYESRLDEIRAAIRALPDKQRAAVLMHKYEELEYCQIAGALNCSVPAIKSLLFRAYETLRARLAHLDPNVRLSPASRDC